jgi:hypothetical protein
MLWHTSLFSLWVLGNGGSLAVASCPVVGVLVKKSVCTRASAVHVVKVKLASLEGCGRREPTKQAS